MSLPSELHHEGINDNFNPGRPACLNVFCTILVILLCCAPCLSVTCRADSRPPAQSPNIEADRLQIEGTRLQLRGDLQGAVHKYRESLALKPDKRLEDLVHRLEQRIGKPRKTGVARSSETASSSGWSSDSSFPPVSSIKDICRVDSKLYAVTDDEEGGKIISLSGQTWKIMKTPEETRALKTITCISGTDIYAAGNRELLHYDGEKWQKIDSPLTSEAVWSSIWHTDDGHLVLAGKEMMITYDSEKWSKVKTGLTSGDYINAVGGENIDQFFAVGGSFGNGFILKCNALECQSVQTIEGSWLNDLYSAPSGRDMYAAGGGASGGGPGVIFHYDGSKWSAVPLPKYTGYLKVIGKGGETLIAAGNSGGIVEYTQAGWKIMPCPYHDLNITSFWNDQNGTAHFSGISTVLSSGASAITVSLDGEKWSVDNPWLNDVMAFSDGTIFAVGTFGTIKTYRDGHWKTMQSQTTKNLVSLWGSDSSDIYAVGEHGALVHFDGSTWKKEEISISDPDLLSIWGAGKDNIYIMAKDNEIYHFDGKQWKYERASFDDMDQLFLLSGSSATNIYAAGTAVYHFDGSGWSKISFSKENSIPRFTDLHVTAAGQLAAIEAGTLYLFDGSSWTKSEFKSRESSKITKFTSVWGDTTTNLYLTGYEKEWTGSGPVDGLLLHYDGRQWSVVKRFPMVKPLSLDGFNGSATVLVGENGLIGMKGMAESPIPASGGSIIKEK